MSFQAHVQRQRRCFMPAWGIAPGIEIAVITSAESALHCGVWVEMLSRNESRFQR
jgi:hypothetical protein